MNIEKASITRHTCPKSLCCSWPPSVDQWHNSRRCTCKLGNSVCQPIRSLCSADEYGIDTALQGNEAMRNLTHTHTHTHIHPLNMWTWVGQMQTLQRHLAFSSILSVLLRPIIQLSPLSYLFCYDQSLLSFSTCSSSFIPCFHFTILSCRLSSLSANTIRSSAYNNSYTIKRLFIFQSPTLHSEQEWHVHGCLEKAPAAIIDCMGD